MVNALFSWPVIGALVAIFIGIGGRAMGMTSSYLVAKICFATAGLIFLTKFGTWIASETYELKWRIPVAFIIFGAVGLGWILSWQWVNKVEQDLRENQAKQAYAGRLEPEKKVLFSTKDHIYPEFEFGDSGAVLSYAGPPDTPFIKIGEDNDIKIELIKDQIQVSTKILGSNGQMIAEIVDNEWKVKPQNAWDRNYSKNALEVRDPHGDVILQVRLVENRVQFQAKLYDSTGRGVAFVKSPDPERKGGFIEFTGPNNPELKFKIEPIFKYPSELHLGEFADSK